ncbi:hypothetical protein Patl1_32427 [Pistacia atlantica]|uniref:Uncharacterized protein n=1 Tax=Pistacia atlantica TaxID=434234 RepID=A0ACC1APX0_9ROSI|nr:hypothetical protein Patl1_32427 [Pistacia atlantica]
MANHSYVVRQNLQEQTIMINILIMVR